MSDAKIIQIIPAEGIKAVYKDDKGHKLESDVHLITYPLRSAKD